MSAAVTHFEIYGDDLEKLAQFYRALFGWEIEKATAIDYYRIQTGAAPATIQGGMLHRPIPGPRSWVHYVHVDSVAETMENATKLGGKVVRERAAVPKTGWYAVLQDPEGNIFAVFQPDPNAMPPPEPD